MKSAMLLSSVACLVILGIGNAAAVARAGDPRQDPLYWDSLVFTVQWPITTCIKWKEGAAAHTCLLPEKHLWTIHGVWPTNSDGPSEGPFFCNRTWIFDPDQVQRLKPQLVRYWPNIHGGDTEDSLWKHEWEKHGTCAALLPKLSSEQLYFNQGLKWASKYRVADMLTAGGVDPSMNAMYNATRVWQTLKDSLGFDPSIACEYDKETGVTYLSEVRVCFQKDFKMINCTSRHLPGSRHISSSVKSDFQSMSLTNCPTNRLISYPGDSVKMVSDGHTQPGILNNRMKKTIGRYKKFHPVQHYKAQSSA